MSRILIVLAKELRELLREPHVLGLSIGFPLIFYPLMVWGGLQFKMLQEGLAEKDPPQVAIIASPEWLADLGEEPLILTEGDPKAILDGALDAHLVVEENSEAIHATLTFQSTEARSTRAKDLLLERLDALRDERTGALTTQYNLEPKSLDPFEVEEENLAPPKKMGSFILSRALPGMVVIVMLIAGLYPAVEVVVGERERSTLETTLSSGASRRAIVLGKILAILTMIFIAVFGNMFAMGLTLLHVISLQPGSSDLGLSLSFVDVSIVLVMLLLGGVLVASMMVLSVLPARSFKEGQNLASFTMTAGMALVVVAMLPGTLLELPFVLIPLSNIALVIRDGLNGDLNHAMAGLAIAETAVLSGGLLYLCLNIVEKESYLFAGVLPPWLKWMERFHDRG